MSRPDPVQWSSGEEQDIPLEGVSPGHPPSGSSSLDSGDDTAAPVGTSSDPHWSTNPSALQSSSPSPNLKRQNSPFWGRAGNSKDEKSLFSEEDLSQLDAVLSSEEGKKILQQLPLEPSAAATPATPGGTIVSTDPDFKGEEYLNESNLSLRLELDGVLDDSTALIIDEGLEANLKEDLFLDHGYCLKPRNQGGEDAEALEGGAGDIADGSKSPGASTSTGAKEEDEEGEKEEEEEGTGKRRKKRAPPARRSTRIQENEIREKAEKIKQENLQKEQEALSAMGIVNKPIQQLKKYNMRAKRSQKEFSDFIVNYSPRRKKTPLDDQTASDSKEEEEEGNDSESVKEESSFLEEEKEEGQEEKEEEEKEEQEEIQKEKKEKSTDCDSA